MRTINARLGSRSFNLKYAASKQAELASNGNLFEEEKVENSLSLKEMERIKGKKRTREEYSSEDS